MTPRPPWPTPVVPDDLDEASQPVDWLLVAGLTLAVAMVASWWVWG